MLVSSIGSFLALLLLVAVGTEAVPASFYGTGQCIASTKFPRSGGGLEFCHWYNDGGSCCLPAHDGRALNYYASVMDIGIACSHSKHSVRSNFRHIREWLCLSCDPGEPTYRFRTRAGDLTEGGQTPPDLTAGVDDWTWRVCRSFVYGADGLTGGLWGINGTKYDSCGLKAENPCGGGRQQVWDQRLNGGNGGAVQTNIQQMTGWNHFMCGDNIYVPSVTFGSEPDGAIGLMTDLSPPNFGNVNFRFVVSDDHLPVPCFRGTDANPLTGAGQGRGQTTPVGFLILVAVAVALFM